MWNENMIIDEEAGEAACGTRELFMEILSDFVCMHEFCRDEIDGYYLCGDIKNYTIKVHALKSTARLIGATVLSEEALYLEECAKDNNIDEIRKWHAVLLSHLDETAEIIRNKFIVESDVILREFDEEEFMDAIEAMREFNEAFDSDMVENVMKDIWGMKIPSELFAKVGELRRAVYMIDRNLIEQIISGIMEVQHGK